MRILFGSLVLIIILVNIELVYAENSGFRFNQATLVSEYKENTGTETSLSSDFEGNWNWLLFDLSSRTYIQSPQDNYSILSTEFIFPGIQRDLTFNFGYRWNHSYNLLAGKVAYQWPLFNEGKLQCAIGNNTRDGLKDNNKKYRYLQDYQSIKFDYTPDKWHYWLKLNRINRDYPDYQYYSSLKLLLEQNIRRKWANFEIGLGYKVETGKYPFDQPQIEWDRNYWKEKWTMSGKNDFSKRYQLAWEYSDLYHIKGFSDPFRKEQRLELTGIYTPSQDWEYSIGTVLAKLDYASATPDYYEPGYISNDEADYNSRFEKAIDLAGKHRINNVTINIGYYYGDYQYTQKAAESNSALHASLQWKLGRYQEYTLLLKAAPSGDRQRRKGYYQLKLEYKPNRQKRESNAADLDKLYEVEEAVF